MIVFAAIAPHSPLLLPTIGKEHQKKLEKTLAAYRALEEDLYAAKPDTLVVYSPHGNVLKNAFSLFIAQKYRANFKEFGDLSTVLEFSTDPRLIEALRALRLKQMAVPIVGKTEEFCDYGVGLPLYFLAGHLPTLRAVAMGNSLQSLKAHFDAARKIGAALQASRARIAVVASADLAHTLTDAAPGGFSPEGQKFDATVVQALRKDDRGKILKLEKQMEAAKACGLRVIAMLLGTLDGVNCAPELLSYEGPFGVGYLTVRFNFR